MRLRFLNLAHSDIQSNNIILQNNSHVIISQCPEVCEYIRSQPSDQLDYLCKAEEGCRCGRDICKAGSICRQDKCYCGDIDISQYENHQDYECKLEGDPYSSDDIPHHAMVCAADNGCKCGEHRIVKGAECIGGRQVCHGAQIDWVDESVISQYACDVEHPMIVCSNPGTPANVLRNSRQRAKTSNRKNCPDIIA